MRQVLYVNLEYDSPLYDEWLKLIEENDILQTIAQAGQQIDLGGAAVISVLNPQKEPLQGTQSDIDNNSVVLRLSQRKVSFLLTGDIMREAEWELAGSRARLRSTVLKVAHHGSDTSSTAEFLAVVDPQTAVIQVGADNKFGHPDEAVLARLEEIIDPENIYRTDEHGTIEFITNGEKLWVEIEH